MYAFQENRNVSLNVITTAANNQVKQLIRVTIFLEGKGYFSHYLIPEVQVFKDFCTKKKSNFEEREKGQCDHR